MRLMLTEGYKLTSKTLLLALIPLLLLINSYLFYQQQQDQHSSFIEGDREAYQQELAKYEQLSIDQALKEATEKQELLMNYSSFRSLSLNDNTAMAQDRLRKLLEQSPDLPERYKNSLYEQHPELLQLELLNLELILPQLEAVNSYEDDLARIQTEAEKLLSVSIFQEKGSFSYRNIMKTQEDFRSIKNVPLELGIDYGLVAATTFSITDVFVGVTILLVCLYLFWIEKESGIIALLRSFRRGRFSLMTAKMTVLLLIVILLTAFFYGSNILMASELYGFGNMERFIQSMEVFQHSNVLMSVRSYLIYFLFGKLLVTGLLASLFACAFTFFRHISLAITGLACFLGLSAWAYHSIDSLSSLGMFKYMNLVALFEVQSWLSEYRNINFFGYPVLRLYLSLIGSTLMFILLVAGTMFIYTKQYPSVAVPRIMIWLGQVRARFFKPRFRAKLFRYEWFKLAVSGRGYIILIAAAMICLDGIHTDELRFEQQDAFYNGYLDELTGPLDDEKAVMIREEQELFNAVAAATAKLQEDYSAERVTIDEYVLQKSALELQSQKQQAFARVKDQFQYLLRLEQERGIQGSFVNEINTEYLFDDQGREHWNSIIMTLFIMIGTSLLFAIEPRFRLTGLLHSTVKGRWSLFCRKHVAVFLFALIVALFVLLPQYVNLIFHYSMIDWQASIQSVEQFQHVTIELNILEFLLFSVSVRLLGALVIAEWVIVAALFTKKHSIAILLSAVLLLCPLFIQMTGLEGISLYSLNGVQLLNELFAEHAAALYVLLGIGCSGVLAAILSWNKFAHHTLSLAVRVK
ncbi:hypothetical protein ACX1C1_20275 [Paenibacillus sp. strain BS8-2]